MYDNTMVTTKTANCWVFSISPLIVVAASPRGNSCLCFSFSHYPWPDTDLQLMQTPHLLLTTLTPLLKGLIKLDNSRLTSQSSELTVLCPLAAAASVFSLHAGCRGSQSAQCRIVLSSCGPSQGIGKGWVSIFEDEVSVGAPLVSLCFTV